MFQQLVNHNEDIRRLVEEGYAVSFDSNCLVVRDVPYLDGDLRLRIGAIVTKLVFIDQQRVTQDDHQVYFAGSVPHSLDGKPIPNLGGGPAQIKLGSTSEDIVVERSFSSKPKLTGKYRDFFEKIETYVTIISGPAVELHGANPRTFRIAPEPESSSVFKFQDTLTSLAEISDLSAKFKDDVIAVIGVGGTGAYLLDFLVRTPVREIRVFDFDDFHVHNAFRSPGRVDPAEFGMKKVSVYSARYEGVRRGLTVAPRHIDPSCEEDLSDVTFAFVCVDSGSSRAGIFDLLMSKGIPFIDVGMGLKRREGKLSGMVRATYYSREEGPRLRDLNLAPLADPPEDLYKTNVQLGELNALNACLAVLRFKQLRGFYFEEAPFYQILFEVGDLGIAREPHASAD